MQHPTAAPAAPTQSTTIALAPHVRILIGPSGSGKSTYANALVERHPGPAAVVSADDYFMEDGAYRFAPSKLSLAHAACVRAFIEHLEAFAESDAGGLVVVDNTNTTVAEIAPYYAVAKAFGASVTLVHIDAHPKACFERGVHGVRQDDVYAAHRRARDLVPLPYWEVAEEVVTNFASYADRPACEVRS